MRKATVATGACLIEFAAQRIPLRKALSPHSSRVNAGSNDD
jgi:hypothetical protein